MTDRPEPTLTRIPGLDGLRGLAVVIVVAYHLRLIDGGFLGVDVFFVLSGFLVTSLLLVDARQGPIRLRSFWQRRVRRLAPAVLVMVPTVLVVAMVSGWPRTRLGDATTDGAATLTWWANWRQASGISYWQIDTPSLFRHAWSLSVEEQFYLLWPLLVAGAVWFARRTDRSVKAVVGTVAGVGVVASAAWMTVLSRGLGDGELSRAYVGTDTRVFAPLIGCLLACWWSARHRSIERLARRSDAAEFNALLKPVAVVASLGLAGLVVATHPSDTWLYRSGGFLLASVLAAVLIAAVVLATMFAGAGKLPVVVRWTTRRELRYLGHRSYAIYLWSWPVQMLAEHRFPDAPRWTVCLGVAAIVIALAEASHHLVENPIRRDTSWAQSAGRRPVLAFGVALPVAALLFTAVWAQRPPVHERVSTRDTVDEGLHRSPPPAVASAQPSDRKVMVIGDSQAYTAGRFAPTGDQLPDGVASVDTRGVVGCGIVSGSGYDYYRNDGWMAAVRGGCDEQIAVERVGLRGRPDVVVMMPGAWDHEAVQGPDGKIYPSQSPQLASLLVARLVERATAAHAVGAEFVMVEWACPGPDQPAARRDPDYIDWINHVMDRAAKAASRDYGVDAWVLSPPSAVCVGGDPNGAPTDARMAATPDGMHVENELGGLWYWSSWIAPGLRGHQP